MKKTISLLAACVVLGASSVSLAQEEAPEPTIELPGDSAEAAVDDVTMALPPQMFDRHGDLRRRVSPVVGMQRPFFYDESSRSTQALLIPGATILGLGSLLSVLGATMGYQFSNYGVCHEHGISSECTDERKTDAYLYGLVPLVGPFMVAASSDIDQDGRIAFAAFGVAQVAGLAMTLAGALWRQKIWTLNLQAAQLAVGPGNVTASIAF